ncbi:MAG: hypothetical protein HZC47_05030 [Methanobacterium sp.]|uniref:hypothetical protein n=1 Tax=Methanobacterium sp. TaxID=2164 RepID=UPI003D6462FD|nr:hypothetical protein [Methanobacterium sp.]
MLIAENHLQLILEFALIIHLGVILLFNVVSIPLSMVLFIALILTVLLAAVFGIDATFLFLPFVSQHEFTHPFGALAVFAWTTLAASASLLSEVEIKSTSIKTMSIILFVIIAIVGSLMHRSFLILWVLGWIVGTLIMSKSFKRSSKLTPKRVGGVIIAGIAGLGILELLSRLFNVTILSPLLRLSRIEDNSFPSLVMVLKNTTLWGHVQGSCYWGSQCLGGSDGYISVPMNLIHFLTLPFPLFYGVLVTKKDYIDYMLPGIFGVAFDFGFISLIAFMGWCMVVICTGFYVLRKYRTKRKNGSRMYLGREAMLIGALTAFITQAIIGLFLFNRTFNGSAMLTFMLLSALVIAHVVTIRRRL